MRLLRPLGMAVAVVALVVACVGSAILAEAERPRLQGLQELSYFPNGRLVKLLSVGHGIAWSDAAWFQTVQYYGRHRKSDQDFHQLFQLAEVMAELDPHFLGAFRFAGFALGQEGHDLPRGMEVLQASIAHNPDRWEPWFDAGFLCFVVQHDYARAGFYLKHAAGMPGRPEFVERLAAYVLGKAGYSETAIRFWREIEQGSNNEYMRDMARKYIRRLTSKGEL